MKTCLLPITLVMVALGTAQSPTEEVVPLVWSHVVASEALDTATDIALDAAENVVVVGVTRGDAAGVHRGGDDMVVVKLTAAGEEMWRRQFGGHGDDEATAVAVDAAGDIWVVGATRDEATEARTRNPSERDLTLQKLAADGTLLWQRRYTDDGDERVVDLVFGDGVFRDRALYMVGTQTRGDVTRALLMAVDAAEGDAEGEMLWQQIVGDAGSGAYAVAVLGGEVVVGGSSRYQDTFPVPNNAPRVEGDVYEALRIRVDAEGTLLDVRGAPLPVAERDYRYYPFEPLAMAVFGDGLFVLATRSAGSDFGAGGAYVNLFELRDPDFGTDMDIDVRADRVRWAGRRLWVSFISVGQKGLSVADNGRVYASGPFVTSYLADEDDAPLFDLTPFGWHANTLTYVDGALYAAGFDGYSETGQPTAGEESDLIVFKLGTAFTPGGGR